MDNAFESKSKIDLHTNETEKTLPQTIQHPWGKTLLHDVVLNTSHKGLNEAWRALSLGKFSTPGGHRRTAALPHISVQCKARDGLHPCGKTLPRPGPLRVTSSMSGGHVRDFPNKTTGTGLRTHPKSRTCLATASSLGSGHALEVKGSLTVRNDYHQQC